MPDYSFSPQFANLANLQPIQPIDVTRGGALQFQALQPIQVLSSQPELIGQSIAGAVQSIGQGALSGITAKWQEEKELAKEQRRYAHEIELAGAKKQASDDDFINKQLIQFDIAHSGDADYPQRRKEIQESLKSRIESIPASVIQKKEEEQPLPLKKEIKKVDLETPLPEIQPPTQQPPLAEVKPISEPVKQVSALADITPVQKLDQPPSVDKVPLPEPEISGERFASRESAIEAKRQSETNPHWDVKVVGPDNKGYFHLETESKFKDVTSIQRQEREDWYKQKELGLKQEKAAQEKEKSAQELQIRQQKVKDENKTLADHVETAATSLRELDDIISTIKKNPWSVGKLSWSMAKLPIDTDAAKIRAKLESVGSGVAINALTAMRQSSPTGAAVGNASDKDMAMFRATEGSFDPDNLQAKDILPVLNEIKRKRLDIYNEATEKLKANNPEYTPPAIQYPKKEKQQTSQAEDKVSVISPDGKIGKIPKSQVEEAISKGYKLQ